MKETILLLTSLLLGSGAAFAQYDDDIYYNPNKAENKTTSKGIVADGKNYNPNLGESAVLSDADIDAYNGYGGYYVTSIDTIGSAVANSEDFVYTQQIQKFYNPTIVTNNSAVLAEVLENSYGNVSVVYQGGTPFLTSWANPWFDPWYGLNVWPVSAYYSSWYWSPWYWNTAWSFAYNPWFWDAPWFYPGYGMVWAWSGPTYHSWNNYHRNPGAGRPMAHRPNTGLGRGGNAFAGTASGYRRPTGISTANSTIRPAGTATNMNSHRGNASVAGGRPNTSATGATASSHRGSSIDNAGAIRVNPNNNATSAATRNNNATVNTRNYNNTSNYRNTTPARENNTFRNSNVNSNRNSGGATYRNSGGSRGGFGGGSGSRMGGGGSRGGGSHRR